MIDVSRSNDRVDFRTSSTKKKELQCLCHKQIVAYFWWTFGQWVDHCRRMYHIFANTRSKLRKFYLFFLLCMKLCHDNHLRSRRLSNWWSCSCNMSQVFLRDILSVLVWFSFTRTLISARSARGLSSFLAYDDDSDVRGIHVLRAISIPFTCHLSTVTQNTTSFFRIKLSAWKRLIIITT